MALSLDKWHYNEEKNIFITPKVRLTFVALAKKFRSKDAKPDDNGAFCASFIDRPDTDKKAVLAAVEELSRASFKDKKGKSINVLDAATRGKLKSPFLDADGALGEITSKGEAVDLEGWKLSRPNTYTKAPAVRNAKGELLDAEDVETEAYSGRWARLELSLHKYDNSGNSGIKFYLNAVQLLSNDDNIGSGGGSKGESFDAVEDDEDDDGALS